MLTRSKFNFIFCRFANQDTAVYSSSVAPLKLKAQPKSVHHEGGLTALATLESVLLVKNGATLQDEKVNYEPSSVSISKDLQTLAVGDAGQGKYQYVILCVSHCIYLLTICGNIILCCLYLCADKSVHIYDINGGSSMTMKKKIMLTGPVTDVAFSPDGKFLVASDGNRKGK